MSIQESSHFAIDAQAYYPGQSYNTPAMLQLAASINVTQGRLLDVGCGNCQLLKLLAERFPETEMAGLTVSEDERRECDEYFDIRVGDMHSLPWQDAEFDAVISRHSLEHSVSPLTALFEINRVLRLDGIFYVVVPAPVSEWIIKMKDHFSVLARPMWEKLFDDAGFAVEQYEEGTWLASFSMQHEPEMRFRLRKVRDVRLGRASPQKVEPLPGPVPAVDAPVPSTLVERRIVVVLHNLVLFDAIRSVVAGFGRDVKFLVPLIGDAGFDAMGERTCEGIAAAGFEVARTALPADVRCDIELSPYPYAACNVSQAKWRVRFMYGLAKEAWNFSLRNNVYYDFVLAYGDYDARVLSAYSTPVRIGNSKIHPVQHERNIDRPVLLYLPTYGPPSSIEAVSRIQIQLKRRFRVITKAHHGTTYLEPERVALLQTWADELAHHDSSLSSLLASADVVLSDGSGAIFDAIAAGVPVAVFQDKVFSGLCGTVSLEERLVQDGLIPATDVVDEIPAVLDRALQAGIEPLAALRRDLFVALGDEATARAAAFLSELLIGSTAYDTYAVARRSLLAELTEGGVQRYARYAAERQLDEAYRNLTDRLLADMQAGLVRLAERDGQIVVLNQAVADRDGQIANLNQAVADRDGQIANLNQAVADRDGQIANLNQAVADRDGQIVVFNQAVAERKELMDELARSVEESDRQIASLQNQVMSLTSMCEAMRNSRSWRVSRPMRFAARLMRHGLVADDRRWLEKKLRSIFHALPVNANSKATIRSWYVRFFGIPFYDGSARPVFFNPHKEKVEDFPLADEMPELGGEDFLIPEHWTQTKEPYCVMVLPIIDWHFRFQRPQQIARRFAQKGHLVAYASLSFGSEFLIAHIEHGIEELRLPGAESTNVYRDMPNEVDIERLARTLRQYMMKNGPHRPWVCIVQLPYWGAVAERLKALVGCPIVYDCMDDHAGFSTNGEQMLKGEDRLLRHADLVVASSRLLFDKVQGLAKRSALIRNGVDYAHFSAVPGTSHSPISNLKIGYYGAIADWFDSVLVAAIANLRPSWRIVLIGSTFSGDTKPLTVCSNISLPGEKPYSELPQLISDWDCCIIPFRRLPLTEATNPVKIYEMLAAGKPVVSVGLPELLPIAAAGNISLAETADEFILAIENEVLQDSALRQEARRRYASDNTWEIRQEAFDQAISLIYPLVSIVVVTYNNISLNRLCLESLFNNTDYPNYEIIVVDNASSDGTPGYLKGLQHPRLTVILNDENLGFAAANNQGLARASGEFLCLLNNDTVVAGSWLSTLVKHLIDNPEIGLIGPVTNAIGNEAKIPVGYRNLKDLRKWASAYCEKNSGCLSDISMLAFFCVVMPRAVFERVGLLDDRFGIGMFEDDDYNRRVRHAGYKVQLAKDAFIHHWQRASFKLLGEDAYIEIFKENEKKYQKKWITSDLSKEHSEKFSGLIAASKESARTIIFAPSIGWNVHLFQRPHHLARAFAQDGFTVVFDCSNSQDDIEMLREIEPRLFLYKGNAHLLADLHNLVLWTFSYNYDYRDCFPRDVDVVYDWIDDLSVFPYDQAWLAEMHSRAMREATVVAAVARKLHESALLDRRDAIYLPNAVEEGRFDHPPTPNPALEDSAFCQLVSSGKPIAGYYGALARWFDYDLLIQTAHLRPDWEFVLIGPDHDGSLESSDIKKYSNITWLGPRDYQALPGFLYLFDVAIIPFKINEITVATSPLKLFEYFSGGKPVISTPMPECAAFDEVYIVSDANEFSGVLDVARESVKNTMQRRRLHDMAQNNTWHSRVHMVMEILQKQ